MALGNMNSEQMHPHSTMTIFANSRHLSPSLKSRFSNDTVILGGGGSKEALECEKGVGISVGPMEQAVWLVGVFRGAEMLLWLL